ncbi:MAG: hypothetical protein ABIJ39_08195 [Chloroflexota bacterium]
MKTRTLSPFLALAGLILIIGLACATSTPVQPTNPPPPPPPPPATNTPIPPPTPQPTPPPQPQVTEAPVYFTEDFSGDLDNWSYEVILGDEDDMTISFDSYMTVQLDDPDLYVYFYYEPYIYENVRVDMIVRNSGRNSNNVNVVCNYSNAGWYEFTVQNDGLYSIWAYDAITGDGYVMLQSGGSTAIRQGRDTNVITAICERNELTLGINGVEVKNFRDTIYNMVEGQVGLGVNVSYRNPVVPVIVTFEAFQISEP